MELPTHVFLTVGRMNPPTPGHILLIEQMLTKANEITDPEARIVILLVLSSTANDLKNPLECDVKQTFLVSMIHKLLERTNNQTKYVVEAIRKEADSIDRSYEQHPFVIGWICGNPFLTTMGLLNRYTLDSDIHIVLGSDREDLFESFKTNLLKNVSSRKKGFHHISIERLEGGISATQVRKLVSENDYEGFKRLYSPHLDKLETKKLYDQITEKLKKVNSQQKGSKRKRTAKGGKSKKFHIRTYKYRGFTPSF